jgi:hypothetical protein
VCCAPQDLANVKYMRLRHLKKLAFLSISQKSAVQHLQLHGCYAISSIDLRGLSGLTTLDLLECQRLTHLPGLGQLAALQRLYLTTCLRLELPDLSGMSSLREFYVDECCSSLTALSGLQHLKSLKFFSIHCAPLVRQLGGIGQLPSLDQLRIINCQGLKALPDLSRCTKLSSITLDNLPAVRHEQLHLAQSADLTALTIRDCGMLSIMQDLSTFTRLQWFHLSKCQQMEQLPGLQELARLQVLELDELPALQPEQLHLAQMAHLEVLGIRRCGGLSNVLDLSTSTRLLTLHLSMCKRVKQLPGLQELGRLRSLDLDGLPALQQDELPLAQMADLEVLSIRDCGGLSEMPDLSTLTGLQRFTCSGLAGSKLFPAKSLIRRLHTFCNENDMVGDFLIEVATIWPKCEHWRNAAVLFWLFQSVPLVQTIM